MSFTPDPVVEAEVDGLQDLDLRQLKTMWAKRLGAVPKHQSADLLRRRLAYEIQASAYGGLQPKTRRRLRRLHEAFTGDRNYSPSVGHSFKPGTILTRAWKGVTHQVNVLEEGFEYSGKHYQSLSEIARLIAGTNWSGPTFFGLRNRKP